MSLNFEHVDHQENFTNSSTSILPNCSFVMAKQSKIMQSKFEGNGEIGEFSCINRSTFGLGSHLGVQSYVSDTVTGRFTMIGSRVSIGGFEHPLDWLSIAPFQWGQSVSSYAIDSETISRLQQNAKPAGKYTQIGNDVWIGNNAVIKAGIHISDGAVIGAGSVVTKDVRAYEIVAGNPARFIRHRFSEEIIRELLFLKWWSLSLTQIKDLDFRNINTCLVQLRKIMKPDQI